MTTKDIARHARALLTARGDAAEVEAARKATTAGPHEAEDWRRIRAAIRQLRGALAS
ncbi:MAG: hypothetical protein AAF914_09365 [Pseudomonadota bacterium]